MIHDVRPGRVVIGVLFFLIGLSFLLESVSVWHVHPADFWPLFLISFGVAVLLGRARRMKVEEDRTGQLAVAEERVRIARELHDIVAHSVSLMTIQIAAARRAKETKPEEAENSLKAAEDTGRQTLAELHQMLSMLRGADASIGAAGQRTVWTADVASGASADAAPRALAPTSTTSWNASRLASPGSQAPGETPSFGPGWTRPRPPAFAGRRAYRQAWGPPWWPPAGWPGQPAVRRPPPPAYAATGPSPATRPPEPTRSANGTGDSSGGRAPLPRLADLDPLVQGLRDAGLDVNMTVAGTPPPLPASVELAIYRVVQESLTNALRYAGQGRVLVEITYTPEYIVLFVDDDGPGPGGGAKAGSRDSGGHGLLGMQERIAAVGGTLTSGPRTPGPGWRVHARIPMVLITR
jgi:signal transduction histidine kinase